MDSLTLPLMPPALRDERGIAFAGAVDKALALEPWQAAPLKVEHSAEEVLWALSRQFDVAGPLMQAMRSREQRERLILSSIKLQQKRGTPWSVEEVMRLLGWADAKVLDRTNLLIYDGTANHDGRYVFNSGVEEWDEYKVRLFIDEGSRTLTAADKAEAARMAADWAPLRSTLVGWEARHLAYSYVPDPLLAASRIVRAVMLDKDYNRQTVDNFWLQYLDNGAVALRWLVLPGALRLADVSSVALIGNRGREAGRRQMPIVEAAADVLYECAWTFIKEGADA